MIGYRVFRRDFFASDKADESHRLPTAGAQVREKGLLSPRHQAYPLAVSRGSPVPVAPFALGSFATAITVFGALVVPGDAAGVWRLLTCYHDATTIWIHAMAGKPGMR